MKKYAEYISHIEINNLWGGKKHISWDLRPDVNILSGVNGVGKSTILNRSVDKLDFLEGGDLHNGDFDGVHLDFYPLDATQIHYDVIRSVDRPLIHSAVLEKLPDDHIVTELDFQLYQLQRKYLDYQVNIGNRMIKALTAGVDADLAKAMAAPKQRFQDIVDELFADTGKHIQRDKNEITFTQDDEELPVYKLSSGEKQVLVILLTVLVQDMEKGVLLMDEPEVSLHIEWQQRLITLVRELNPNLQIIIATHSPAVIMEGWVDAVTEVSDITISEKQ